MSDISDIPINPELKELPPLSDFTLLELYNGLERNPTFAAIRSLVREIQTSRARVPLPPGPEWTIEDFRQNYLLSCQIVDEQREELKKLTQR